MPRRSPIRPLAAPAHGAGVPRAPWAWAAAGAVLGVLVAFALLAPARWLTGAAERAAGGHLRLADARGTVWSGSVAVALAGGPGSSDAAALPGRVGWRIRPGWGRLVVRIDAPCCSSGPVAATLAPRWRGFALQVADTRLQVPAQLLRGLGTPWNTLELGGDLALSTYGLAVDAADGRMLLAGSAELLAERLASRLSPLKPLGSYRLLLSAPAGAAPALQLATLDGALQLDGQGQWVGQRLRFAGSASARPGSEAALANLLNIIGRRQGDRSLITIG